MTIDKFNQWIFTPLATVGLCDFITQLATDGEVRLIHAFLGVMFQ